MAFCPHRVKTVVLEQACSESIVIPSKRSLRGEGSGRAARSVAFFAAQYSRVWLASLSNWLERPSAAILSVLDDPY
jgi:hypothetical protein